MKKKLSDEQAAVVASKEPLLLVNAFAGAGKTSTILEYIANRPKKKILAIVFNKSASQDMSVRAKKLGLDNARFSTINGYAWSEVMLNSVSLKARFVDKVSPFVIAEKFGSKLTSSRKKYLAAAKLLIDIFDSYCKSGHDSIDLVRQDGFSEKEAKMMELSGVSEGALMDCLRVMEDDLFDNCGTLPVCHDGYMKILESFSKIKDFGYDEIIVDEAQDTTNCALSFVLNQKRSKKIFVGDKFQQIYAWSGCVNSFGKLKNFGAAELYLSRSFRCPEHIAGLARPYLALLGNNVKFHGTEKVQDDKNTNVIICRSNAGIVNALIKLKEQGYPSSNICLYGGVAGYNFQDVFDVANLADGNFSAIKSEEIKNFPNIDEYAKYVEDVFDYQGKKNAEVIKRHGPQTVFHLKGFLLNEPYRDTPLECDGITLSTGHKAKGSEFDNVQLGADFPNFNEIAKKEGDTKHPVILGAEELRILYVALTRGKQTIDSTSRILYGLGTDTLRKIGQRLLEGSIKVEDVDEIGRKTDSTEVAIEGLKGYALKKQESESGPTQ